MRLLRPRQPADPTADTQPWRCTHYGPFGRCTRIRTGNWNVCWRHLPRNPARPA
jgi:hypothetical protein